MQIFEYLRRSVAIRHKPCLQARFAGTTEDFDCPFTGNQRFVVSTDHNLCALGQRLFNQQAGISLVRRGNGLRVAQGLRRDPVLAVGAVQIAAEHPKTVGERAGISVEEGLLLNRVALHSGDISPGNVEGAATIVANLTDTGLSLANWAAVAAGIAADAVAIQFLPESGVAFADARIKDVAKGGHNLIVRRWEGLFSDLAFRSVHFGLGPLVMAVEPCFGLLAGGSDLRAGHLIGQPFKAGLADFVALGGRDCRPVVGFR